MKIAPECLPNFKPLMNAGRPVLNMNMANIEGENAIVN
jgi:hypothetical protein